MIEKIKSTIESRMAALDDSWVNTSTEVILEPELPIVDPHHHFWDYPTHRYLLEQLLADTGSGHKIEATVFIECAAFYRRDASHEMKVVGEVEFVNGQAAMAASGRYGDTLAAAGIVGFADLTLGAKVEKVLSAQVAVGGGRRPDPPQPADQQAAYCSFPNSSPLRKAAAHHPGGLRI